MSSSTAQIDRDQKTGGLWFALWMLARAGNFEAIEPSRPSVRYLDEQRRGVAPLMDVYLPRGAGPHPSVLLVHGGGFLVGHRRMKPVRLVATRLCERGFAVCSMDYRLLFRGGALDEQLADVDAAAAYWVSQAERFGCDPTRVSMVGLSAGAALMLLHAGQAERSYRRLVSFYGPSDFSRITGRRAELVLRWLFGTDDRAQWKARSPASHAKMRSPLLLIHGTHDQLIPVSHSMRLHEARIANGLPTELELVAGMRHGWLNDPALPQTERAIERAVEFLERE